MYRFFPIINLYYSNELRSIDEIELFKKFHDKKEISLSCETSNEFSGDNDTLDLGSSFIDLINFGISHEFLDRILAIETVSTENLDNTPFKQKKNAFHLIGLRG